MRSLYIDKPTNRQPTGKGYFRVNAPMSAEITGPTSNAVIFSASYASGGGGSGGGGVGPQGPIGPIGPIGPQGPPGNSYGTVMESKVLTYPGAVTPTFTQSATFGSLFPASAPTAADVLLYVAPSITLNLDDLLQVYFTVTFENSNTPLVPQSFVQITLVTAYDGTVMGQWTGQLSNLSGPTAQTAMLTGWYQAQGNGQAHILNIYVKLWNKSTGTPLQFHNAQLIYNVIDPPLSAGTGNLVPL